jgi:hypothetical protein
MDLSAVAKMAGAAALAGAVLAGAPSASAQNARWQGHRIYCDSVVAQECFGFLARQHGDAQVHSRARHGDSRRGAKARRPNRR